MLRYTGVMAEAPQGQLIVDTCYYPGKPPLLDLTVETEDGKWEVVTIQGKAARKLSKLRVGDRFLEETK